MAMACDLILAGEKAKFGQPETGLGITPGFSGTQRLLRRVGVSKAKELIYTGRMIDAQEALQIDLPITSTPTISCRQKRWLWQKKSQPTHPLPYAMQNVPSTKGHRQTSILLSQSRTNGFPNALLHKIKRKACRHSSKSARQHSSINSLQIKYQDCMKRKAASSWLKMD